MKRIETKLMIVEDQKIMLESLEFMLKNTDHITVVDTAMNGLDCINILEEKEVDLIIMDYQMPVMNGYDASKIIMKKYPTIKILILTMYNEYEYTKKLIDIDVHGILLKDTSKDQLLDAIDEVRMGNTHYSPQVSMEYMKGSKKQRKQESDLEAVHLSDREKEVLILMTEGVQTDEIASICNIAPYTVATHRKNIYRKTQCNHLPDLVILAIKMGLIKV